MVRHLSLNLLFLLFLMAGPGGLSLAQRQYASHSALSAGNWYKLAVHAPGIYKIDLPFLRQLGLSGTAFPSAGIRLLGNGGAMLPEAPNGKKEDDLTENAIQVVDGGDGMLDNNDYILFYANGPHEWLADSLRQDFRHRVNLYSDTSYYYISVGANGKRIATQAAGGSFDRVVTSFDDHIFHELDSVNFLSSGKSWVGEELSNLPGHLPVRNFNIPLAGSSGLQARLRLRCLARSIGQGSQFQISSNAFSPQVLPVSAVAEGNYEVFVRQADTTISFTSPAGALQLTLQYFPGSYNSQGWLDWFELLFRRPLAMTPDTALLFRDWQSVSPGTNNKARFDIQGADPSVQVWDVSQPLTPLRMTANLTAGTLQFINDCSRLHEYIAFRPGNALRPAAIGAVANQDLHQPASADMLIITHPSLLSQAQRLAAYHAQQDGLKTITVTTDQLYNEFSSGIPDPTAIRDYAKMFYDRSGGDSTQRPRYLLLLGDASFDYKDRIKENTNLVPAWESEVSYDPLATYASDDFFAMLDDDDDINGLQTPLLDIGVGRIPASNLQEATAVVDKILAYHAPDNLGPWHNEVSFVADDEDNNLHLQDAEQVSAAAAASAPALHINKIYLDAYRQESGPGGSRYPDVNRAITNQINTGNLVWNYNGHGSYSRLAEEDVLDQSMINQFSNQGRWPLLITATCDFAPYDNPLVSSIGENLLLRPSIGAIALMTTNRLVFAFSNKVINRNYAAIAFHPNAAGVYPSLGEAVRWTKNYTYTYSGDVVNNRKFTLLGDPALTLAFPRQRLKITAINGKTRGNMPDTLKALSNYQFTGEVTDFSGNRLNDFSGTVYVQLYDKQHDKMTLGNDPGSPPVAFPVQDNLIFRGKATVINGEFSFACVVPKDIGYAYGPGRLGLYANSSREEGSAVDTSLMVGGTGAGSDDKEGPEIQAWLNDRKFINGGLTNAQPVLLLDLSDSSGINILGTGIGHNLQAMLDNDPSQVFVLNDYYTADADSYKKGTVRFPLPGLEKGLHRLSIRAWDVANNSAEAVLDFHVEGSENLELEHVLNYPNPFTTHTSFWFDHNRPGEQLDIAVRIFTISGKLVKTIRNTIFSAGNRSNEVNWDGRDDFGSRLARGVYIYQLKVRTQDGKSAVKWEKLYIL